MTPEQRTAMYVEYLTREGYRPKAEGGVVSFRHEGGSYAILVDADDEQYFQLIYPGFWSLDGEEERDRAYRCANEATAGFKVAKVYVTSDGTDVWADVETYVRDPSDYEAIFPRALAVLPQIVHTFAEKMGQR